MNPTTTPPPSITTASTTGFDYIGGELALFENAVQWKRYWRSQIAGFIRGDVLEVGAGIGANTEMLSGIPHRSWTCVEPDGTLAAQIAARVNPPFTIVNGTIEHISQTFDAILYIDVLEHIEDDTAEMARAAARLTPGGYLIVLSPAHANLFTPFDQAIGHYRRYSRQSLGDTAARAVKGASLTLVKLNYMDSVGLMASAANRLLLRQSIPTKQQILLWDRLMVPFSRLLDPCFGGRLGKSILGIWKRG